MTAAECLGLGIECLPSYLNYPKLKNNFDAVYMYATYVAYLQSFSLLLIKNLDYLHIIKNIWLAIGT